MISDTRRSICARRVGDDALLELLLDARAVEQVEDPAEAERVLEVVRGRGLPCRARTFSTAVMRSSNPRARSPR